MAGAPPRRWGCCGSPADVDDGSAPAAAPAAAASSAAPPAGDAGGVTSWGARGVGAQQPLRPEPLRRSSDAARADSGAGASGSGRQSVATPTASQRDSVRLSFERAARELQLRDVHSPRPAARRTPRLRHPEALRRPPARVTTAAALGLDASGSKCVNQYAKVRKLGAGSYSKVVLHRSREDGALYAVKVLSRAALARRHVARGASALADAMREAQLLRLLDHPNIVRLEEVIDDPHEDRLYLVMQYLEGGAVMQDGDAALAERDAAVAVADVAAALSYLHWQGVCHGDVKPENMLRGADGRVRLTDFSVSQVLGGDDDAEPTTPSGSLTGGWAGDAVPPAPVPPSPLAARNGGRDSAVGRTPGTPAYTAPECTASGAFSGEAADVWALGVSLYAMLTGAPPFVGDTLLATYELISTAPLQLPAALASSPAGELLRRMLEKDPAQRATLDQVRAHPWLAQHAPDGAAPPAPNTAS